MGDTLHIIRETLRGKSLVRTFMNLRASSVHVSGSGIDLGSKDASASHFRFLSIAGTVSHVDLHPGKSTVQRIDLEKPFAIDTGSQDFLLLFNVLEHLFDYSNCLRESLRVLKPGGTLVGAVPFLYRIHPDPDDHFRYTKSTIVRLLSEIGYETVVVDALGRGPFTVATSMILPGLPTRLLRAAMMAPVLLLDGIFKMVKSHDLVETYPLAYFFIATKPQS